MSKKWGFVCKLVIIWSVFCAIGAKNVRAEDILVVDKKEDLIIVDENELIDSDPVLNDSILIDENCDDDTDILYDETTEILSEDEVRLYDDPVSQDYTASGKKGNITWSIDKNGKLVIKGSGDFISEDNDKDPAEEIPWYGYRYDVVTAEVDLKEVKSLAFMFYECENLVSVDLTKLDTSKTTNMAYMFEYCSSIKELDLSGFNTSGVTNMNSMFAGCTSLKTLDIKGFNTSNVRYMYQMFVGCSSLKSLDVSQFTTSKVSNMYGMFYGCTSLEELDLSNFNLKYVTDFTYFLPAEINMSLHSIRAPYNNTKSIPLPGEGWKNQSTKENVDSIPANAVRGTIFSKDDVSVPDNAMYLENYVNFITCGYTLEFDVKNNSGINKGNDVEWYIVSGNDLVDNIQADWDGEKQTIRVKTKGSLKYNEIKSIRLGCKVDGENVEIYNEYEGWVDAITIDVYGTTEAYYKADSNTIEYYFPAKVNTGTESGNDGNYPTTTSISDVTGARIQVICNGISLGMTTAITYNIGNVAKFESDYIDTVIYNLNNLGRIKDTCVFTFRMRPCDINKQSNKNLYSDVTVNIYKLTVQGDDIETKTYYGREGQQVTIEAVPMNGRVIKEVVWSDDGNVKTAQRTVITNRDEKKNVYTAKATFMPTGTVKGDVTGDGEVAMGDVVKVAKVVAGTLSLTDDEKVIADVTGDGEVAMGDVVRIAKYVAGTISEL